MENQNDLMQPVAWLHIPKLAWQGKVRPVVSLERYADDDCYAAIIPLYTKSQLLESVLEEREACAKVADETEYCGACESDVGKAIRARASDKTSK